MTSSSEQAVHTGPGVVREADVRSLPVPELRSGTWTRFGERGVLGDAGTERALSGLAESTRDAARAQGYTVGWSEGRREAAAAQLRQAAEDDRDRAAREEARAAEHAAALTTLARAAEALDTAVAATCTRVVEQASTLALEVVRTLLAHELRVETADDVVARALAVLPEGPSVEVRLPVGAAADAAADALRDRGARVGVDPALAPGDAVVVATDHVVDLSLDGALARLDEVLTLAAPSAASPGAGGAA